MRAWTWEMPCFGFTLNLLFSLNSHVQFPHGLDPIYTVKPSLSVEGGMPRGQYFDPGSICGKAVSMMLSGE